MARTRFSPSARPPDFGGRYRGQVCVVTGASAGLGAQLCRDLARAGASVVGLARSTDRLDTLAAELRTHAPASATITCDVADTAALRRALGQVAATQGPIDLLVNNAAQDPAVRLVDIAEEDFRRTFDVNFFAPVAASLAVIPGMVERGSGTIVNVSSDGGRLPSPGPGAYPSSKAALSAFTESASFRLAPKGVRVHVVYPAFMATELGLGALERGLRRPPRLTTRQRGVGVAPDPGASRGPHARDQRLRADRRCHGVPLRDAPDLPPPAPQLVGRLVGTGAWSGCCRACGGEGGAHPERTTRDGSIVLGTGSRRSGRGRRDDVHQPIDDHFLSKYRALLDAEDLAFDELEHACEDGDRMQFDKDMVDWQVALEHKLVFLANAGIELKLPVLG